MLQVADFLAETVTLDAVATRLADRILSDGWLDASAPSDTLQCLKQQPDSLLVSVAAKCSGDLEPLLTEALPSDLHIAAIRSRCRPCTQGHDSSTGGKALSFKLDHYEAGTVLATALPALQEVSELCITAREDSSAADTIVLARSLRGLSLQVQPSARTLNLSITTARACK